MGYERERQHAVPTAHTAGRLSSRHTFLHSRRPGLNRRLPDRPTESLEHAVIGASHDTARQSTAR